MANYIMYRHGYYTLYVTIKICLTLPYKYSGLVTTEPSALNIIQGLWGFTKDFRTQTPVDVDTVGYPLLYRVLQTTYLISNTHSDNQFQWCVKIENQ